MAWSCSRCDCFLIPLLADRLNDLKKLKALGEWQAAFAKYEYICSGCLEELARKPCSICSKNFNVLNDCRPRLVDNFREHKQDSAKVSDKKQHVCPACFEDQVFAHCVRCRRSLMARNNHAQRYLKNEDLREWLSPCHPEFEHDWEYASEILCPNCYKELQTVAAAVAGRYRNWAGGTKEEFLRGCRIVKQIGRIEEDQQMEDPEAIAKNLKLYSAQVGGNAYIKFFWERHQERHADKYVAGHGPNGNPYYRTNYRTMVWYTGYATAVWVEPRFSNEANASKAPNTPKTENDFARILDLKGKVTREEIRKKYRELTKQYHPDRVADLGPELREVAERKMKEINRAFEFYKKKYGV